MAINNVTLNKSVQSVTTATVSAAEKERENLQQQIAGKEQRLNRLSTDSKMTAEEKEKERQEVQKQIQELNRKLRLLQMEKKEEAQKAAKEKEQELRVAEQQKPEEKENAVDPIEEMEKRNLQLDNIHKILASDAVIQQNLVQESVSKRQEGKIRVLENEIKSDGLYGTDTTAKQKELSALTRQKKLEIEPKEQGKKLPENIKDSGAKIVIK